jgi:hypothetical protein
MPLLFMRVPTLQLGRDLQLAEPLLPDCTHQQLDKHNPALERQQVVTLAVLAVPYLRLLVPERSLKPA